jgi:copper homeostasis protein
VAGKYLLEISVETVEHAVAAECGGADRLELCSELAVGGLTPSAELMRAVRARVKLPLFAMIRPRAGDFAYSAEEFAAMRGSIELVKRIKMEGVVLGLLTGNGQVDFSLTRELVEIARPLPVTFHRAIDETADMLEAVEDVAQTGASRILTSGGKATAFEGAARIAEMVSRAGERIIILPGAGIHAGNIAEVARVTGAKEFHSGLSSVIGPRASTGKFEEELRKLVERLRETQFSGDR